MILFRRIAFIWFVCLGGLASTVSAQEFPRLDGHASAVYSLQMTKDGKTFLTGDVTGTVLAWDGETKTRLQSYALGSRGVLALSVSPDLRQFAACSVDGKVMLCDVPLRNPLGAMGNAAPGVVSAFATTPDGRFLLEGDQGNYIRMWDANTGAHVRDFGGAVGGIFAMALDPSQPKVLAASMDGMIRGWTLENAQPAGAIQTTPLRGLIAIPGESTRLATLGDDGSLKLVRWPPVLPQSLQGHSNQVAGVAVSPDGKWIFTGGLDQQLNLSKSADGAFVKSFAGQPAPTSAVAFNAASTRVAAANQAGTIKFWNVEDGTELGLIAGHTGAVFDIAFHGQREELVSAGNDGTLRIWDVPSPGAVWTGPTGTIAEIALSSKASFLASAGADKAVRLINSQTGELTKTLDGFDQPLTAVALSGDDQWIAAGDATGQVHLRKVADGSVAGKLKAYDGAIGRLLWKPDGKQIVACGSDGKVKIYAVPFTDPQEPVKILEADTVRIYDLAQSKDGSILFTAGEDKLIKLWSADGQMARQIGPYASPIRRLKMNAEGTAVAAVGDPSTVQTHAVIWNVADGQPIRDLDVGVGITGGDFLPDGTFVAYCADRKARRFDLKTPLLLEVVEFATPITTALSLPDGKAVIAGGADNKLYRMSYNLKSFLTGHTGPVRTVLFDQDDVLSGGDDMTVRRWKTSDRSVLQTFPGHTAAVFDLAISETQIATACADTNLRIYPRAKTPEQLAVKDVPALATIKHPAVVRSVTANGPYFVTGADDSLLRRWDPLLGELERWTGQGGQILSLAALADGRVVSGASDNTARLWSPAVIEAAAIGSAQGVKLAGSTDGRRLAVLGRGPAGMPDRLSVWNVEKSLERTAGPLDLPAAADVVAVNSDAGLLALGIGPELSLWNLTDLKKRTAVTLAAPVSGIVFSQKGKRLTASSAALLQHFDVISKGDAVELTLLHDSIGHPNNVVALAIAPDDRTLWTAAQDNVVRKYQSASPVPSKVLAEAVGPVYSASYSADGKWLATGGADGRLRVWNVATGAVINQTEPQSAAINQVAFSIAGDLLIDGSENGSVRIWNLVLPKVEPNAPPVPVEKLTAKLEPLYEWKCQEGGQPVPVRSVILSADLNWVLAGTSRGVIFAWKTGAPDTAAIRMEAHNSAVTSLRYNVANNRLASFDAAGHVAIWNPANWSYLAFQRLPKSVSGSGGVYALDNITWILGDRKGGVILPPVVPAGR